MKVSTSLVVDGGDLNMSSKDIGRLQSYTRLRVICSARCDDVENLNQELHFLAGEVQRLQRIIEVSLRQLDPAAGCKFYLSLTNWVLGLQERK